MTTGALPDELVDQLRILYSEDLGIPLEEVTESADLEADLGVDSLHQIEMLDRAFNGQGLGDASQNYAASEYPTLRDIADLVGKERARLRDPHVD